MSIVFYLNIVSPHQLPLAEETAKLVGEGNFCYLYAEEFHSERAKMGWDASDCPAWCAKGDENSPELISADIVYTGIRCLPLMERRWRSGKTTCYCSERWFKPIEVSVLGLRLSVPGWVRMVFPRYFRMVRRFVRWANGDANARVLAIGPWAKRDFIRMGVKAAKLVDWGYFVAPGRRQAPTAKPGVRRVLWVGRMLDWKRVDVIVRAIAALPPEKFSLTLVGDGPERARLEKLAQGMDNVTFKQSVPIGEVRGIMREHDVYVLSSNSYEGWGAVVSEALEEGMLVLGTREAGATKAMLPEECLFRCGDWRSLAKKLAGDIPRVGIGEWTAVAAARRLIAFRPACVFLALAIDG